MRPKCYIAGPISRGDRIEHFAAAFKAFRELYRRGFAPVMPQLSMLIAYSVPEIDHEGWLQIDLPLVASCEALLRLPGESVGADREAVCAREHRVPVFTDMEALVRHFDTVRRVAG